MKAEVTDIIPAVLPGVYGARFDAIEPKTNETGTYWLWTFTLAVPENKIGDPDQYTVDGGAEYALIPITATTSPRITPRTKAAKWIEALHGGKVEVGQEVDFDALLTSACQVVITVVDTGYSRIESVLPAAS